MQLVDNWVWGVDIFFMLRGFILAYTYLPSRATAFGWVDYRSFIVKRFARVYPLYLATALRDANAAVSANLVRGSHMRALMRRIAKRRTGRDEAPEIYFHVTHTMH
ncbi:acyltransferase [Paraburkholderia sp. UCT2]|uniref:acyltransferase n=1 Tax=Paraburkholderia sp. UCT2 TaxID=2615208 RepID=UPI00165592F4|nr:acyltransferase [Paraburkholderia sp. UCT2]MBC8729599.1 acyltransferase [Paraburkholderia sp. UCT2]